MSTVKLSGVTEEGDQVTLTESRSFSLSVMSNGEVSLSEMVRGDSRIVATYSPDALAWITNSGDEYGDLYLDAALP